MKRGSMSAIGTKQTLACALHMSAFDPKRTSPPLARQTDIWDGIG